MKMPVKKSSKNNAVRKSPDPHRCAFQTSDGRRCRMLRCPSHPCLCVFHSREEQQLLESQKLGAQLAASLTGDFLTATDINYVLGKLFTALAQNRIPVRNARTLAYIAQAMLLSLPTVKKEFDFIYKFEQWNNMLNKAVRLFDSTPAAAAIQEGQNPGPSTDETNQS